MSYNWDDWNCRGGMGNGIIEREKNRESKTNTRERKLNNN